MMHASSVLSPTIMYKQNLKKKYIVPKNRKKEKKGKEKREERKDLK